MGTLVNKDGYRGKINDGVLVALAALGLRAPGEKLMMTAYC